MRTQFASYYVRRLPISLETINEIADGEVLSISVMGTCLKLMLEFESDLSPEDVAAAREAFEDRARLRDVVLES